MGGISIKLLKEILTIFVVFLFLSSLSCHIFSVNVLAQNDNEPLEETQEESESLGLIGRLAKSFGRFYAGLVPPFQFFLMAAKAEPSAFEIGYGETFEFEIGFIDLKLGGFQVFTQPKPIFNARYLNFEVIEYPGGNDQETWTITFQPYTVDVKYLSVLKTNATISLRSPPVLENAIQSGVLKIRIWDTWANGDLWHHPGPKGNFITQLINRATWFIFAFINRYGFFSGTVDVQYFDVEMLVKIKPYHALSFDSVPYMEFKPDTIATIPISLRNMGNYNDTFSFNVVSDNKDIKISDPLTVTLAPGEIKDTYIGVSIPPNFFDFGTIHEVVVEAYSIDEPTNIIAERTIIFETKGLHVTEMGAIGVLFLIFILILLVGLFIFKQKSLYQQYCVKPDKPWDIPEETRFLEKLKETDKEKYKETLNLMEEEYNSAVLWHKYYCESQIRSENRKKEKIRQERIQKKKTEKEKLKKEKLKILEEEKKKNKQLKEEKKKSREEPIKKEKKPEKPKKVEKEEVIVVDKKIDEQQLKKDRAFLRIKQEQEKQRRKLNKSNIEEEEE